MTKQEMISSILELEWDMFHNVNGDTRADCQENRVTFEIMRRAQYEAWSEEAVASFHADITSAKQDGRNLSREKYIRMMKSTDPQGYDYFKKDLPELTEAQIELVQKLWEKYLSQTERMREKYPILALGGRPLRASEEVCGMTSIETYQTSETMTYSENTLRALLSHLEALEAQGIDLAYEIQKNTVLGLGYPSMDAAEAAMMQQLLQVEGESEFCCGN